MQKKFLSMLLALMMVLSILPTAVFATEQATVAAPLDSIVPYGANDQTTGTANHQCAEPLWTFTGYSAFEKCPTTWSPFPQARPMCKGHLQRRCHTDQCHER